jgi:DNA-binding CsgD family transcriptional regulator
MPNEAYIRTLPRMDAVVEAVAMVDAGDEAPERGFDVFLDALYVAMLEPDRLKQALRSFASLFRAEDTAVCVARGGAGRNDGQLLLSASGAGKIGDSAKSLAAGVREQLLTALDNHGRSLPAEVTRGQIASGPKSGTVYYLALTGTLNDQRALALVALRSQKPFADEDRRVAHALLPDIERAFNLHLTHFTSLSTSLDSQLFESSTIAQILTCQRAIERSNERARKLLEIKGPISLTGRLLRFEDARVQSAFEALSEQTSEATNGTTTFASVVAGQNGATWLAQLSRLKRRSDSPLLAATPAPLPVLVALTQFNMASSSRELPLDGFTELSTIERTILSAIVDGHDVAEISASMRRSSETIRWHVKRMFAKLGVSSQADLARLGSLLLPISF